MYPAAAGILMAALVLDHRTYGPRVEHQQCEPRLRHNDPVVAARIRAERLERKAAAYRRRYNNG